MDTIGIDLHKRESQVCILTDDGELVERRIATTRERLTAVLGARPASRVLLEASTESEWVARHVEALGHEVIVADPGYAPMYATRSRRVKTDKRDARTLCEACKLGAYRAVHRASDAQRHVRAELAVRDAVVRTRTRYVAVIKALVRRDGLRLAQGEPERTAAKVAALLGASPELCAELAPLVALLDPLNAAIAAADARLVAIVAGDPVVTRLTSAVGVGPVTAVAFVAALDDVTRFQSAHQVMAYLGLVPSERSSGERQHRGHITKAGSPRVALGGGRVANSPLPSTGRRGAPGVGGADRAAARAARRRGRTRAAAGRDSLRHVARWAGVPSGAHDSHAAGTAAGGGHGSLTRVTRRIAEDRRRGGRARRS